MWCFLCANTPQKYLMESIYIQVSNWSPEMVMFYCRFHFITNATKNNGAEGDRIWHKQLCRNPVWCLVWKMFFWHSLRPLIYTKEHLNSMARLDLTAEQVYPFVATVYSHLHGHIQHDNAPYRKGMFHWMVPDGSWNMPVSAAFTVLQV